MIGHGKGFNVKRSWTKHRDKQVLVTEDMPEWLVQRIAATEMDPKFAHLDEGLWRRPNIIASDMCHFPIVMARLVRATYSRTCRER